MLLFFIVPFTSWVDRFKKKKKKQGKVILSHTWPLFFTPWHTVCRQAKLNIAKGKGDRKMMGVSACLEVILEWKSKGGWVFFFFLELEDLCHQRIVPQGKKQQGKGLWVIPSPGIRGVPTDDNELGFVCFFSAGVKSHVCYWLLVCLWVCCHQCFQSTPLDSDSRVFPITFLWLFWDVKMVLLGTELYLFHLLPNTHISVWTWAPHKHRSQCVRAIILVVLRISFFAFHPSF